MKVLYIGHYKEFGGWAQAAANQILALDKARRLSSPSPVLSLRGDPPRGSSAAASLAAVLLCPPWSDCTLFSHLLLRSLFPDFASATVRGRSPSCWRRCRACRRSAASMEPVVTRPSALRALYSNCGIAVGLKEWILWGKSTDRP